METKLAEIAQIAKERPKEQFTSLVHLLNVEMFRKCHRELSFTGSPSFNGLYKMGARYYNREIGRFITRDTYRGDIYKPWTQNLYSYCNNNPVDNSLTRSGIKPFVK